MSLFTHRTDKISADSGQKISGKFRQNLDLFVLALSLAHCADSGQKEDRAGRDPKAHRPEIAAGGKDEVSDPNHESGGLFPGIPPSGRVIVLRDHLPSLFCPFAEKELEQEPETGKKTVQAADVPVAENTESSGEHQPPDTLAVYDLINSKEHQGQHIDSVQPHDIAALGDRILHETIAH